MMLRLRFWVEGGVSMLLRGRHSGDHRAICRMCGLNLRSNDPVALHALIDMHFRTHVDDLIQGAESLLKRCCGE